MKHINNLNMRNIGVIIPTILTFSSMYLLTTSLREINKIYLNYNCTKKKIFLF